MRWSPFLLLLVACADPVVDGAAKFTPREPPPAAITIADTPYWQEINHPRLATDPLRGPINAVILEAPSWPSPLAVGATLLGPDGASASVLPTDRVLAAIARGPQLVLAMPDGIQFLEGTTIRTTTIADVRGLFGGPTRAWVRTLDGLRILDGERIGAFVDATAVIDRGAPIYASATRVFGDDWSLTYPKDIGAAVALVADVDWLGDLVIIGASGILVLDAPGPNASWIDASIPMLPFAGLRVAARVPDGGILIGGEHGLMRLMDRGIGLEWRTYPAERWLPSPEVRGLAIDPAYPEAGSIWVATAAGLAEISATQMTLEQKITGSIARIVDRHDRDGAVADSRLTTKGDLGTNIPWDSDNDGTWTSYWLRGECYRWLVTRDPDAKAHFDKALERMLSLHDLTGTDHFLARAVIRKDGCALDDCDAPDDGEWFTSPDAQWWVKGDTSNDEVIAHFGMMGQAYDLCADEPQKERIRKHVAAIAGGIMDHGWQLVDIDGQVTTYGQFDPRYVNESLPGIVGDGGLRSAAILAGLDLAYYLTGEARFLEGKRELIETHHYADNAERELGYGTRTNNMDNDEMDVWSWMVLLRYEQDPALLARWEKGWAPLGDKMVSQQGAWWNLVQLYNGAPLAELDTTLRWLRLAPVDMIRWTIDNDARLDLVPVGSKFFRNAARMRSDRRPLPYDERPNDRWNTDQYKVTGGFDGYVEMDGADVLEPYWMGRYYGWITK